MSAESREDSKKGMTVMIEITSLNGCKLLLNSNLIETIQQIPETKVSLTNEKYYLVQETQDEIIERIIAFNRKIYIDHTQR